MDIKKPILTRIGLVAVLFLSLFSLTHLSYGAKIAMATTEVAMYDNYFSPKTITIAPGQRVVWVNKGNKEHNVTISGLMDSGHIPPGGKVSYTFVKPGVYDYRCSIHSVLFLGMRGQVIVR